MELLCIHMEHISNKLHDMNINYIKCFVHVISNHMTPKDYEPQPPVVFKIIKIINNCLV